MRASNVKQWKQQLKEAMSVLKSHFDELENQLGNLPRRLISNEGKAKGLTYGKLVKVLENDYFNVLWLRNREEKNWIQRTLTGTESTLNKDTIQYCREQSESSKVDFERQSLAEVKLMLNSLMQTLPNAIERKIGSIFSQELQVLEEILQICCGPC